MTVLENHVGRACLHNAVLPPARPVRPGLQCCAHHTPSIALSTLQCNNPVI